MKKLLIAIVTILIVVFIFSGCSFLSSKTPDFNKRVAKIDKQIKKINKLQSQAQKYLSSLNKLSADKKVLKKSVSDVDKVISITEKATNYLYIAIAQAQEAKELNASTESSSYAEMLSESFKTRLQSYKLMGKGLESFKDTLNKVIADQITDSTKFKTESQESLKMLGQAVSLEQKADEQYSRAQDYYSKNLKK